MSLINVDIRVVNGVRFATIDGEDYGHIMDLHEFVNSLGDNIRHVHYSVTAIAAEYGLSAVKLNRILAEHHVQYYKRGTWHLYKQYTKRGFVTRISGKYKKTYMQWTRKGKEYIEQLLAEDGYTKKSTD